MTRRDAPIVLGLESAIRSGRLLGPGRIGLITNFTGTTTDLGRSVDALLDAGVPITTLFGPEHGLAGSAQAGGTEPGGVDEATGLPVVETYATSAAELDDMITRSGIDVLVFDMQDVGVRYYTYIWTMYDCMLAAARTGRQFVVLDRPNPLTGAVSSGPWLEESAASFVGRFPIPLRHGLTAGELARYFAAAPPLAGVLDLDVVPMIGWDRRAYFDQTGLPWVPPSPNIPTMDTALAFAGFGLFEGVNVSEGRGTTKPFETIGAPYADGRLASAVRDLSLPGVRFRAVSFVPTFHKYAGESVHGVQLHIDDRGSFDPIASAVSILGLVAELYPDDFAVLPARESGDDGYPLDRLWGSDRLRHSLQTRADPNALLLPPSTPETWAGSEPLLY